MIRTFLMCALASLTSNGLDAQLPVSVPILPAAPVVDGRIAGAEYGSLAITIPTAGGAVTVWLATHGEFVHVAASLPDSTFYWAMISRSASTPMGVAAIYQTEMTDSGISVERWTAA